MNQHSDRARRYYNDQELRPDVPVYPQPNNEDKARRLRVSGVRTDTVVRDAPKCRQPTIGDMEDITSSLKPTLPSQGNKGRSDQHQQAKTDNEVQNLGEDYEMVGCDIDLTEDFEEVNRDIPFCGI
jgi:hypothetical protein